MPRKRGASAPNRDNAETPDPYGPASPRFPDTWMDHRPGERYPWADTLDEELDARERRERARYPETEDAA